MSTIQDRIARLEPTAEHGTAANRKRGCPCLRCKAAMARYDRQRKAEAKLYGSGLVSAVKARKHLRALSNRGIGYRQAAKASGLSVTVCGAIKAGRKKRIFAKTERRILALKLGAVQPAMVSGRESMEMIAELQGLGYKAKTLAEWYYGHPTIRIQLRERITAETRDKVAKFYADVRGGFYRRVA